MREWKRFQVGLFGCPPPCAVCDETDIGNHAMWALTVDELSRSEEVSLTEQRGFGERGQTLQVKMPVKIQAKELWCLSKLHGLFQ